MKRFGELNEMIDSDFRRFNALIVAEIVRDDGGGDEGEDVGLQSLEEGEGVLL